MIMAKRPAHLRSAMSFVLCCLFSFIPTQQVEMAGNATDLAALLAFKTGITHDPALALNDWNVGNHLCNWTGVECNTRKWRVVGLNLINMSLEGNLASQLGNLSFLHYLDLSSNRLTGQIPAALGRLRRLKELYLNRNMLEGPIPISLGQCQRLRELHLSKNNLKGNIPHQLGNLHNLQVLGSWGNGHTGIIPKALGNCSMLQAVDLSYNNLTGTMPVEIGFLTRLQQLILDQNHLSGGIPPSLLNCTDLRNLSLIENSLSGPIPSDIGIRVPKLQWLLLAINKFNGSIPKSLGNCSSLSHLEMAFNEFSGIIPQELGQLPHLMVANLPANHFVSGGSTTIPILDALSNCSRLQKLDLSRNKLTGTLPKTLGRLSENLIFLSMERNSIGGSIPKEFGNLSALIELYMSGNSLVGSIPSSMGNLLNLVALDLSGNKLEGNIPREFDRMQSLESLSLSHNMLSGEIPHSIGNLQNLRELNLSINKFSGRIPSEIGHCVLLEDLALFANNLTGAIPSEVANLRNLQFSFDLSENSLTGPLPPEIGGMQMVQLIDLSVNKLSGHIPSQLSGCVGLRYFNLSFNKLSGMLPTSIGQKLGIVEVVDLSVNILSGPVPVSFSKFEMLSLLNLSYNNLSGPVPCGGALKKLRNTSFLGNPGLCGKCLQLPICPAQLGRREQNDSINKRVILIVSTVSSILVICCFGVGLWIYFSRSNKRGPLRSPSLKLQHFRISSHELNRATENYSPRNLIGVGSYGSVYRGILPGGKTVAVKVFSGVNDEELAKSFARECKTLGKVRHRNLVKILSSCSAPDFKALVLQFMAKGSLDKHLHGDDDDDGSGQVVMSLKRRLSILSDVAHGISYLHHDCVPPIVHCDLKPQNVLLDETMTAHVSDFGIARLINASDEAVTTTSTLRGSVGYFAPEYGLGGRISTKGDVYSYGILLLEMITQKRPTDEMFVGGLTLARWVSKAFDDGQEHDFEIALAKDIINRGDDDDSQEDMHEYSTLDNLLHVGLWCTSEAPESRPTMREVETILGKILHAMCDGSTQRLYPF
eukprot:Gb_16387 [translate_table: standard]